MVMRFSERHKLSPSKIIQLNSIDLRLQNRLLNIIRDRETPDILDMGSRGKVEKLLDFLGESYDYADDSFTAKNNIFALKSRKYFASCRLARFFLFGILDFWFVFVFSPTSI